MEDCQLNDTVAKAQNMEPSQNHDENLNVEVAEEFNSVVDDGTSNVQREKISEDDKEYDEKNPRAEDSVVEKGVVKSVVEPLISLPEGEELSPNVEQAVATSLEPDAAIKVENKGIEENSSQSPEERVGNSSIANPDVGTKGVDGTTQADSDESTKIAPTVTDVAPKGIEEKAYDDSPPKGVREAERSVAVASTGESSATSDEQGVNNADASSNQWVGSPGVGSSDGGQQDPEAKISERSENYPIVSPTQQTLPSTSWRSCCGLLEVLLPSNRIR